MKNFILSFIILLHITPAFSQLSLSGQLRTRTEFRNGQGNPLPLHAKPAFFTSQRTRLSLGYNMYRLKFNITAQDIRVWGQDASTISRTTVADNNGIMLHEAWAEILLSDTSLKNSTLNLKLGRQELVYDDQRLLGNLDWLQQGRRHDAALLKYDKQSWSLHLGTAFNQNRENGSTTVYNNTPAGNNAGNTNGGAMYKSMQFLYAGKKLRKGSASFLFFADQFSKYRMDTVNSSAVKTFEDKVSTRFTTGFYLAETINKLGVTASAYYQFGKTGNMQKIRGALLSVATQYNFSKSFSAGPGFDYTSGGSRGSTSNAFDPLYGTPHKFWGLMDYYYAGSGFGKSGLVDYYIKAKYKPSLKWLVSADLHQFSSAAHVAVPVKSDNKRSLGQEVDIVGTYGLSKQITIEGGYARYFTTSLLTSPAVKNIPNAKTNADWVYLMISIKPEFLFK